jgi:beta-phosphoglucomutase-like phosphatase (HAD superfamily)
MNIQLIATFLSLLLSVVPQMTNSQQVNSAVNFIQQIIPLLVKEYSDLLPIVKNILALLKQNGTVTPEQNAAMMAVDAQIDKAFDDALAAYLVNHPDPAPTAPLPAAG